MSKLNILTIDLLKNNKVFDYSNCDAKHGEYLYTFSIDEKAEEDGDTSRQITIDPLEGNLMDETGDGTGNDLRLLYINDIRKDLYDPEPTKEDKELQNCSFIVAKVYGWPLVFVMTIKSVKKGEELLLDYGESYSVLMKENKRWGRMMDAQRREGAKNVVGNVKQELMKDHYNLDI